MVLSAAQKGVVGRLSLSEVVSVRDVTDEFRVACINTAAQLTSRLVDIYREVPAAQEVWLPLLPLLAGVARDRLPATLAADLDRVQKAIETLPEKPGAVVKPAKQVGRQNTFVFFCSVKYR